MKFINPVYLKFLVFVCLFFGLVLISTEFIHSPVSGFKDGFVLVLQWFTVCTASFFVLIILSVNRYVFAVLFPLLVLVCAVLAYFRFTSNSVFTSLILDAALNNDARTSLELVSLPLLLFVFVCLLFSYYLCKYRFRKVQLNNRTRFVYLLIACSGLFFVLGNYKLNRPIASRIPLNLYYETKKYISEKTEVETERPSLSERVICQEKDSLVVVFVIGESLRAENIGLNGYHRNTTPKLNKQGAISLKNVYSPYSYTYVSVPYIMTRADSLNPERAYSERSFIDIFKACNFETFWLGNQDVAKSYVYFAYEAHHTVFVNRNKSPYTFDLWLDEDLLPEFTNALQTKSDKKLIVLHTIGSHWWYNSHFPEEYTVFTPIAKSRVISSNSPEQMINSYDNTVLYTDNFLSSLIDKLKDKNALLLYLSDHGENLGEKDVWLHASESEQTQNPASFIWFSEEYLRKNPDKKRNALQNKDKKINTSFLFHSILDGANIKSDYFVEEQSVFR